MKILHFLHDRWVPDDELSISGYDTGIIRGYGVFDVIRTYNAKPFMIDDHIQRFRDSAHKLYISIPQNNADIAHIIVEGIQKNRTETTVDFDIRLVVTGGIGESTTHVGKPTFYCIFSPASTPPPEWYEYGIFTKTVNYVRPLPNIKSTNYLVPMHELHRARMEGMQEILLTTNDEIVEGATSNFFAVANNVLYTANTNILPGVTRNVTLDIARTLDIPISFDPIRLDHLQAYSEAFITGSSKEIVPIARINNYALQVSSETLTAKLQSAFKRYVRDTLA